MSFENLITEYDRSVFYFLLGCVTFYSTAYLFCSSLQIKLGKQKILLVVISGLLLSIGYSFVILYNEQLSNFALYLLIPLILSQLREKRLYNSIAASLISLGFFQIVKVLSTLIVAVSFWMIRYPHKNLLMYSADLMLTALFCVLFMKIQRFKKGFQFFEDDDNAGLGIALSSIVLILTCIDLDNENDTDLVFIISIFGALLFGFGLYLWIRRSITAHYRERLQLKTEEHYKIILEERNAEIKNLKQTNEYLARIVHRDNHVMSNLNTTVNMYFDSEDKEYKDNLLRELQTLYEERGELINKELVESKTLPLSGNTIIDGTINDLYIKAVAHGIDFNLTVSSTIDEIIGKYISQTDLQTLLCDHIKDAIIAIDSIGESDGKILINLSTQNENYCIDIYDNGVEFNINTLSKLGLERVTTHEDSGGSGIGFMTTFETLKKAYASIIITEFENRTPFSKSVRFCFDGKNAFIIHSYRSNELKSTIKRKDILFDD